MTVLIVGLLVILGTTAFALLVARIIGPSD